MQVSTDINFFLLQDIPEAILLVRSGRGLLRLGLAGLLTDAHGDPFFAEEAGVLVELVLQEADVAEDTLYALMVLDHLLVVAAALVGRAGLDVQAQQLVYLQSAPILHGGFEQPTVLLEKAHVVKVFLQGPQGFVEPPLLPAQFSPALLLLGRLDRLLLPCLCAQGLELEEAEEEALVEVLNSFHFFRFPQLLQAKTGAAFKSGGSFTQASNSLSYLRFPLIFSFPSFLASLSIFFLQHCYQQKGSENNYFAISYIEALNLAGGTSHPSNLSDLNSTKLFWINLLYSFPFPQSNSIDEFILNPSSQASKGLSVIKQPDFNPPVTYLNSHVGFATLMNHSLFQKITLFSTLNYRIIPLHLKRYPKETNLRKYEANTFEGSVFGKEGVKTGLKGASSAGGEGEYNSINYDPV